MIEVGQHDGAQDGDDPMDGGAAGRLRDEELWMTGRVRTRVQRSQWQPGKLLWMCSNPFSPALSGDAQHQPLDDVIGAEFVGTQAREGIDLHHLVPVVTLIKWRLPFGKYLSLPLRAVLGGPGPRMSTDLVLHDT
jgi:hypothetical protein